MVVEVKMFTVVCDNCKKDIGSEDEYSCWNDDNYAESNASDSDWLKLNTLHYCPECYSYDDNDAFVLAADRKDKHL